MSQDLLSFLDGPEPASRATHITNDPTSSTHDSLSRTTGGDATSVQFSSSFSGLSAGQQITNSAGHAVHDIANDDDDDFGDFEDASTAQISSATPAVKQPSKVGTSEPPAKPSPPRKETRTPFPPKGPKTAQKPAAATQPQTTQKRQNFVGSHPFAGRMGLLFEADDEDYDAGTDELGDLANNPAAAMEYSKRIIAEQQEAARGKGKGKSAADQSGGFVDMGETQAAKTKPKAKDPNVLFDADDVSDDVARDGEEDDDFGDFATWDAPASTAKRPRAGSAKAVESAGAEMDLLGLDDEPSRDQTFSSAARQAASSPGQSARMEDKSKAPRTAAPTITHHEDDFWDDFETTPVPRKPNSPPAPSAQTSEDAWPDFDTPAPTSTNSVPAPSTKASPSPLPPTNIPPPLHILTLYPSLFSSATSTLLEPLSKLDSPSRATLLAHPATHQFLRAYLSSLAVLARILAGRKLRWKRDKRLNQSMSIGAASGRGGMKLAGLDKSEREKEEREVMEVVRLYRAQVGRLRAAVAGAGIREVVPEVSAETVPVRALKQSEGGITAREACALCGLRREERAAKMDDGVQDSFGEWWDQARGMHVQCVEFWERESAKLRSR